MTSRNDILRELKQLDSHLADMSSQMPFEVPEGYFDQLSDATLNLIRLENEEEPVFRSSKSVPFSMPEGYFENLSSQILQKTEEMPGWDDSDRKMPMEVPAGYFENLPQQVLEKAKKKQRTNRIIEMPVFKGIRWMAAAVVILGIGVGSYKILQNTEPVATPKLAVVPVDSIHAYVRQNIDEFESEMLEKKIASNEIQLNVGNNQINKLGKEEIIQYLNEIDGHEKTETE